MVNSVSGEILLRLNNFSSAFGMSDRLLVYHDCSDCFFRHLKSFLLNARRL